LEPERAGAYGIIGFHVKANPFIPMIGAALREWVDEDVSGVLAGFDFGGVG
jgi:hypothetical protein